MDNLAERIFKIAADELEKRSFGLNMLGLAVEFGDWIVEQNGQQGIVKGYALVFAMRPTGPKGEVLLGTTVAAQTHAHIIGSFYPSEVEIRTGVAQSCDAIRQALQAAPQMQMPTPNRRS